ncbi:HNH endonuclease [Actinomadura sp. HBU206391]|uniref:HNH endonuclease n=1 Tax=Actinomadura sp. HBU206391 TaxID=2731692 RepID=UPI0016504693|nr:HNH endonuclease signature motif containing protein [Actinomadura sp. HBU206391]MBC6456543.1 DUF222 domain-containing protein [Actinomadura sp. HBU206391]
MTALSPIKHETVVAAERLETEICELAGHLAAATCRYLLLLAEFDRRDGWGGWGIRSCAQWLSWKCGISPATAREQVRVARSLAVLPVTTEAFSAGRLSYSKVRALTRVATSDSEAELVETALVTTAAQLERIVAGLRKATRTDVIERHSRRKVTWHYDEDGSFVLTTRLDPEEGAIALAALRAARAPDSDHAPAPAHDVPDVSAETSRAGEAEPLALPDALTAIFSAYLGEKVREASDPEAFQVVHTDPDSLAAEGPGESPAAPGKDVTPGEDTGRPGGHLDDGPALHPDTVRRLACDAFTVTLIHRDDGSVMDAGRRTRRIGVRLRRALRTRDQGRCRFPGCRRRLHLHAHHVVHWSHGGPTNLDNLASLCTAHHWLVHDGGYRMWLTRSGDLRFATPAGVPIPAVPAAAPVTGDIRDLHRADITSDTVTPDWDGTRLDLDNAVLALLQPAARPRDVPGEARRVRRAEVYRPIGT